MENKKKSKCSICGEKEGTHYFGEINVPIGKGEYVEIGDTCLGCPVVEWTGKKQKFEYWECDDCFNEAKEEIERKQKED